MSSVTSAPHRRRVPMVAQVSQTECGMCSCLGILGYYGREERITTLRQEFEAGRDGLSIGRLVEILRSRGMQSKVYRLTSAAQLARVGRPVILFWEGYHFLVLERMTKTHAFIMDPAVGRRTLTLAELEEGFSDIILDPEPAPGFQSRGVRSFAEWRSMPLRAPGVARSLGVVSLLLLAGYGVTIALPIATQSIVDGFTRAGGDMRAMDLILGLIAAAALYYLLQVARTAALARTVALLGQHLMQEVFRHLLRLPYPYFSTRPAGELMYRLSSVNSVRDLLSTRLVQMLMDIGTTVCLTVYLAFVAWQVLVVALVIYVAMFGLLVVMRSRVTDRLDAEIGHSAKSQAVQVDAVSSVASIKMGGYTDDFIDKWSKQYALSIQAMAGRMRLQQGVLGGIVSSVQLFAPLALLIVSLQLTQQQVMTIGEAVAVQGVGAVLFSMAGSIYLAYSEFQQTSRALVRISDITETEPESTGGSQRELRDASIRFDEVSFSYTEQGADVIDRVSLTIPDGAAVAIVGTSGAGKSTLSKLLCGLYLPTSGSIEVGGRPLADYHLDSLRQRVGYVPQDIRLHDGTVLENLVFGLSTTEREAEEFSRGLGILDFIDDLPMGYRTIVSNSGTNLSGGQRQRIAIARALLRDPRIMVMDEATSALDTVNESRVTRLLAERGCTQIIFAHRLSTVRVADRIHVLDRGRIVQSGSHDELIAREGIFRDLYRSSSPTLEETFE